VASAIRNLLADDVKSGGRWKRSTPAMLEEGFWLRMAKQNLNDPSSNGISLPGTLKRRTKNDNWFVSQSR